MKGTLMNKYTTSIFKTILISILLLNLVTVSAADSTFVKGVLDNGLTYYVKQNSLPANTLEFRLIFKAGSILETEEQKGLAHFCEHMAFNGTEHFPGNEIIKYLESVGVEFGTNLNASTGFDKTMYKFSLPIKNEASIDSGLLVCSDWVRGLTFNNYDIDAERGVILSEWRTGLGKTSRFKEKVIPKLYYGSRYVERLPIGDTAVIQHFEYDVIKDFYSDWYRPDLAAIIISGDWPLEESVSKIEAYFGDIKKAKRPKKRPYYSIPKQDSTFVLVLADPEETSTSISVLLKEERSEAYNDETLKEMFIDNIFVKILNNRLSEKAKAMDAPYMSASLSAPSMMIASTSMASISITPLDNDYTQAIDAYRAELDRIKLHGVLVQELDRTKAALIKSKKRTIKTHADRKSASFINDYIADFLYNTPIHTSEEELLDYERVLETISVDDISAESDNWYLTNNRIILVETPEKYESVVPSSTELLALFDKALDTTLTAYSEDLLDMPFFTETLEEASVVDSSFYNALNITEWVLSNGVKVILKPTTYSKDYIQFRAFSPGGYSLLPDSLFFTASKMHSYLRTAGFGAFTKADLNKRFSHKRAKVIAAINEYNEGMVGSSDHESLELMMQYIYTHFYNHGQDTLSFVNFKNRLLTTYADAHSNPSYVFSDTLIKTQYQNHPRKFVFPDTSWLQSMTYDNMNQVIEDRFADASDFTFVFVGDFDVDSMRNVLVPYLGNLPNINREEEPLNLHYDVLKEHGTYTYSLGKTADVSKVSMRFSSVSSGLPFEQKLIDCASSIVQMHLLKVLREEEGAIYSISAKGTVVSIPEPVFGGSISFPCESSRALELIQMTQDVILQLITDGVTEDELNVVRNIELEKVKKVEKNNLFWVRSMKEFIENDWPISDIDKATPYLERLTTTQVILAIKQYYRASNNYIFAPNE